MPRSRAAASNAPATTSPNSDRSLSTATRSQPRSAAQPAAAAACAESLGITRPKLRSPVCWTSGTSSEPALGATRSWAPLAGETWSIRPPLVIGSDERVAPDWKSPR